MKTGKSTLIAAFYNRKFVEKYTPTIFDTFTVTTDIYKKSINLEICDSAGKSNYAISFKDQLDCFNRNCSYTIFGFLDKFA